MCNIKKIKEDTENIKSWDLTSHQLCNVEMILSDAFYPLQGFLSEADYHCVMSDMRLLSGEFWPLPVTLDISKDFSNDLELGETLALRDSEGVLVAIMHVESMWHIDRKKEAWAVLTAEEKNNTDKTLKYSTSYISNICIGGKLEKVELPTHYDYVYLRNTPKFIKKKFKKLGWKRIASYFSNHVMHRKEKELTQQLSHKLSANLLISCIVGMGKADDINHHVNIRCHERILGHYPEQSSLLNLVNIWQGWCTGLRGLLGLAIVSKNYGCTHYILESCLKTNELSLDDVKTYEKLVGIKLVSINDDKSLEQETKNEEQHFSYTHYELEELFEDEAKIPKNFSYFDVLIELRRSYIPVNRKGFTVFFTGLSGSGKSTIANALMIKLNEIGTRPVTLLDGDIVRKHLSSELTFSKEHRDLNIKRIGYVASEITKNGGIAICAPIAPYAETREYVRQMIESLGGFVEVYVATPLEVCESRDRKGLYAKARAGVIKEFTGINDPYEKPKCAELVIDTSKTQPHILVQKIVLLLERYGYIACDTNCQVNDFKV